MITSFSLFFIVAKGQAERLQVLQPLQSFLESFFGGFVRCVGNKNYYVAVRGGNNMTMGKRREFGTKGFLGPTHGDGEITEDRHGTSCG